MTRYIRELWYRDEHGRQRRVRVETTDFAELARVAALYAEAERDSARRERAWRRRHPTFTDAGLDPGRVAEARGAPAHNQGHPWEGPHFAFALLLGEGFPWAGPDSLWLTADGGKTWSCRCCGHYRRGVPLVACCLNCDRTGRDAVIPRPSAADLKKRAERAGEPTKVPPPPRDRAGKVLKGGMKGKR